MAKNISVGIDIGTQTTRVVVVEYVKGKPVPRILGTGKSESQGLRQGYIHDYEATIESIKKAVAEAEKNAGVTIKKAFVSIGGISLTSEMGHGYSIISRGDKEVTELDINKAIHESEDAIDISNKKIIHVIPVTYKLDGNEVLGNPEGMQGIKLEVKTLFVTAMERHIENLLGALAEAGIDVQDVIAAPIAASMVALTEKQKSVGCILIDIGAETVEIAVFENGTVLSLQVFPIGSMDITNDIALGFKIPLEDAEKLKRGNIVGEFPKKKLQEIITARATDIFEYVEAHLKKIKRNGLLPAGVIITGGGSNILEIEELSKKILRLPSRKGNALIFQAKKGSGDASWLVALGLCVVGRRFYDQDYTQETLSKTFSGIKKFFKSLSKQLLP
ncbi:cell division protein FtsA [Candidatus Wolfebacteria bacterium]|nr:MAG: cell division protein FtsA [Candidatus Wolfebacteria bacterium]